MECCGLMRLVVCDCSLLFVLFVFFFLLYRCLFLFLCFFFFQAEDGIRDRDVTGVQTCALDLVYPVPGSRLAWAYMYPGLPAQPQFLDQCPVSLQVVFLEIRQKAAAAPDELQQSRSEERRVVKECRSRWEP